MTAFTPLSFGSLAGAACVHCGDPLAISLKAPQMAAEIAGVSPGSLPLLMKNEKGVS